MDSTDDVSQKRAELERCPLGENGYDVAPFGRAWAHYNMFQTDRRIDHLNEAITLYRAALEFRPIENGAYDRSWPLHNLIICLSYRYDIQGTVDDLEDAVMHGRAVIELRPPGHPDRAESVYNLACNLRRRFTEKAAIDDLEEAVELHRAALELRPSGHPRRSSSLHQLALCLSNRYDKLGEISDLEEAITLGRSALDLRPPGHAHHGASLYNLACDLQKRFQNRVVIHDLEEAIKLLRAVLVLKPSGQPCQSSSLHQLALCLSDRYDHQGVSADLEEALVLGRTALELCPPGHPHRGVSLYNLACDLRRRFVTKDVICDLEEAIELHRAALELRPFGHPRRSSSLHQLALCLSNKHDKQGSASDLDEAIALGSAALELCLPGHSDRDVVLYNFTRDMSKKFQQQGGIPVLHRVDLRHQAASVAHPANRADVASSLAGLSQHYWDTFQKQATLADLDEAICLATFTLELRLPQRSHVDISIGAWVQRLSQGSSDELVLLGQAADNLYTLANYLRVRFQAQHKIADLHEAITLYRCLLQFRPTGHPNRASSLHDLAQCLADCFRQQPTIAVLDEAIALEQQALRLLVPGDPVYAMSRRCLTACFQMKMKSNVATTSSSVLPVTYVEVEQVIRNVAFEILKTTPTRLLHTHTGILCDRETQMAEFIASQRYNELLSSCKTCNGDERMELIRNVVSKYFQFVMLSHRWGEGEPSLGDIWSSPIYNLSAKGGFGKLQQFCLVALERDYLWVWSDTCCIDKHSSAEVQETIGTMFAWYRRSALTIVYLSDVPDNGSFGKSEWFKRGWTLQELLAPLNILFYTQNWSLYKNLTSSNHKTDPSVLEELEKATGVESRFLTNFSPGLDDARSRLHWASSRLTTRPEDTAYSLFGIFNLYLPVLYGESSGNALSRLLAEVISKSGDISVLDWVGERSPFHSCFPAHISAYQRLPTSLLHPNAEEQSSAISQGVSSFQALRNLCGSLTMLLLAQFPILSLALPSVGYRVPAVQLRAPDSHTPSDVYDFQSLTWAPLPRFLNRLLILPCIAYRVTAVQLKGADPSKPGYTYDIQASGLTPLEITLPTELEGITRSQDSLHLVRPWHSKLLGPSADLDTMTEEQLLSTLARPFDALLLTRLPHNEHKRIASSTLITVQPIDRASILKSKVRIFNIV